MLTLLTDSSVPEFGEDAEYPQIALGLKHRGTLKETIQYMSEKGMFL